MNNFYPILFFYFLFWNWVQTYQLPISVAIFCHPEFMRIISSHSDCATLMLASLFFADINIVDALANKKYRDIIVALTVENGNIGVLSPQKWLFAGIIRHNWSPAQETSLHFDTEAVGRDGWTRNDAPSTFCLFDSTFFCSSFQQMPLNLGPGPSHSTQALPEQHFYILHQAAHLTG